MRSSLRRSSRPSSALILLLACWSALEGRQPARAGSTGAEDSASATTAHVEACRGFAVKPGTAKGAALQMEEGATERPYPGTTDGRFAGSALSGRGFAPDKAGEVTDIRFTCILDSTGKPVYFDAVEVGRRDPIAVCWDAFEPAGWGPLTTCLEAALKREEAALDAAQGLAEQQAGQSMDAASAKKTLKESNAQWAKYRDSECDRRLAFVAGRNHPDIGELTCRLRETSERIADMKFDEEPAP